LAACVCTSCLAVRLTLPVTALAMTLACTNACTFNCPVVVDVARCGLFHYAGECGRCTHVVSWRYVCVSARLCVFADASTQKCEQVFHPSLDGTWWGSGIMPWCCTIRATGQLVILAVHVVTLDVLHLFMFVCMYVCVRVCACVCCVCACAHAATVAGHGKAKATEESWSGSVAVDSAENWLAAGRSVDALHECNCSFLVVVCENLSQHGHGTKISISNSNENQRTSLLM
jgi:hypothetical protein